MQTSWDDVIVFSLRNMLNCCREIRDLLLKDQRNFVRPDLSAIEAIVESNKKKTELLNKLDLLAANINQRELDTQPSRFLEKLEQDMQSLDQRRREEIRTIVKDLRIELKACDNSIAKNMDMILANLNQFKSIWDTLLAYKSQNDCTYDRMGERT